MDEQARADAVDRILRMVADGKVTAEQGAELMRALAGTGGGERAGAASAQAGAGGEVRGRWRSRGGDGFGIDLAALGRLGRHVARRVESELDALERSARKVWLEAGEATAGGDVDVAGEVPSELLWHGPAPEGGRLEFDVDLDTAGVRVLSDPAASEVRVVYSDGDVRGIGIDASTPRVRVEGDRLVVRQRGRSMMIGFMIRHERLTIHLPPAVAAIAGVVHARNGSVRLDAACAERLELRLTNGGAHVRLEQAEELEVHTVNGAVDVAVGRGGTVRVSSHNGRVRVAGGVARLDADTGNGRLLAEPSVPAAANTWRLRAGNGRVEVRVPAAAGLVARLRSAVSVVEVDLPDAAVRWLRQGVVGAEAELERPAPAGGAILTLEAKATNGRVALTGADAEGQAADASRAHTP
jgi:hypothetical protein